MKRGWRWRDREVGERGQGERERKMEEIDI